MTLTDYIRDVEDFPKKGIKFKDITPLLIDPNAVRECLNKLCEAVNGRRIDKVIGVESRGFFFGILLAQQFNAGFVPVRKKSKLPFQTLSASFDLEYGTDTLEMHIDAIYPGDHVLIHDDVLATGGTAEAVCNLVQQAGGIIVQCNFIMELGFLNGRDKITQYEIYAAINY